MGIECSKNKEQTTRKGLDFLTSKQSAERSKGFEHVRSKEQTLRRGVKYLRSREQTAEKGFEVFEKPGANGSQDNKRV